MSKKASLNIDPEIHKQLKIEAAKRDMRIGELAERILEQRSRGYEYYRKGLEENLEEYEGEYKEIVRKLPFMFDKLIDLLEANTTGKVELSRDEKLKICAVLGYILTPYDLIPEEVYGAKGFIDDVFLASFLLNELSESRTEKSKLVAEVLEQSKHLIISEEKEDPDNILRYVGLKE